MLLFHLLVFISAFPLLSGCGLNEYYPTVVATRGDNSAVSTTNNALPTEVEAEVVPQ